MRIEPRTALVHNAVIPDDHELSTGADSTRRHRAEPGEGVARVLFPIAIGFEDDRRGPRICREPGDDVLEQPRPLLTRKRAEVVAPQARGGGMTAEQKRRRELDPAARVVRVRGRAWAPHDPRREGP